jgi:hypothetical protein
LHSLCRNEGLGAMLQLFLKQTLPFHKRMML